MKKTRATTLCKKLNAAYPNIDAVPYNEFTGEDKVEQDGIWLKGSEDLDKDGLPYFDYWCMTGSQYHEGVEAMADKHGFYCEPYDAGTLMLWRL